MNLKTCMERSFDPQELLALYGVAAEESKIPIREFIKMHTPNKGKHKMSILQKAQNFSTLIPTEERENVLTRGVTTTTKNTNTMYHNLSSLICRNILSCTAIKDYRFKSSSHLHQDDLEILLHAEKVHKNKNEEIPHTKTYKPTHYEIQKTYLSGARSCLLTTHHKYCHIFLAQILSLCPPTKQGLK